MAERSSFRLHLNLKENLVDPKDQEDTGEFGDTTEAVSEQADEPTTDGDEGPKTEVNVDDNATEAAAVETVDTPETISDPNPAAADLNPKSGLGYRLPPTPERPTRS